MASAVAAKALLSNALLVVGVKLENNFFKLLGLEQHYLLDDADLASIRQRARALQRQYHPDRLQQATPKEQQLAAQFSAQVNAAVQILKDPVARAAHMLELAGIQRPPDEHTVRDNAFLMQQMLLHEQLEDAATSSDVPALEALATQVADDFAAVQQQFAGLIQQGSENCVNLLGRLQFFQKLEQEVQSALSAAAN